MTTITLHEVEKLADQLPPQEQLELIRHLTIAIAGQVNRKPSPTLYGSLKGLIPEDFDVEAAITEMRSESIRKLEQFEP